jgi:hypothetical protein
MIQYVIVEDKDGVEHKGCLEAHGILAEDELVTIKTYKGTYLSGFIVEILGENDVR